MNESNFEEQKDVRIREDFLEAAGFGREAMIELTGHDLNFLDKIISGKFTAQEVDAYEASEVTESLAGKRREIVEVLIGAARMMAGEAVNPLTIAQEDRRDRNNAHA